MQQLNLAYIAIHRACQQLTCPAAAHSCIDSYWMKSMANRAAYLVDWIVEQLLDLGMHKVRAGGRQALCGYPQAKP